MSFNKGTGSYLIDFDKFDLTMPVRTPKTSQYALDNGLNKRKRSGFDVEGPAGDDALDITTHDCCKTNMRIFYFKLSQ